MGRKPIGSEAMDVAERSRRYRERQKALRNDMERKAAMAEPALPLFPDPLRHETPSLQSAWDAAPADERAQFMQDNRLCRPLPDVLAEWWPLYVAAFGARGYTDFEENPAPTAEVVAGTIARLARGGPAYGSQWSRAVDDDGDLPTPSLETLGGRDYIHAALEWSEDMDKYGSAMRRNKAQGLTKPIPPPIPGAKT